ncbi:hypothetical protein LSTR_LSTR005156 [Laodelphax striatellus]|uniref:Uncharacterized protein n=1 Tax=Laodelphax striatellus TaxID=195883 RepID=A0A482WZB5_LAOST|nr:hypothetical protein LSTR_LSTR005156 [Laodelphax striatellus]
MTNNRISRWFLALQEFDLEMTHLPCRCKQPLTTCQGKLMIPITQDKPTPVMPLNHQSCTVPEHIRPSDPDRLLTLQSLREAQHRDEDLPASVNKWQTHQLMRKPALPCMHSS